MTTLYYYNIEVSIANGDADSHAMLTPCGAALCLELPSGEAWTLRSEQATMKALRFARAKGFNIVTDDMARVKVMLKLTVKKRPAPTKVKALKSKGKSKSKLAFGQLFT